MKCWFVMVGTLAVILMAEASRGSEELKKFQNVKQSTHFVGKVPKETETTSTKLTRTAGGSTCYNRPWWMSWEGSPARWEKLNKVPVCFGAKDNQYGSLVYGKSAFVWSFKVEHVKGWLSCKKGKRSNFGCGDDANIGVFITDVYNRIQVPLGVNSKFYQMNGFRANSKTLVFSTGESPFGIHSSTELRFWYGEDLYDSTESDNSGRVCVNVYGLI